MTRCEVCGCEFRPWYRGRRCCAKPECGKEILRRVALATALRLRSIADERRREEEPRTCKMCMQPFTPYAGERIPNFRQRKTCLSDACLLGAKSHLPPFRQSF